MSKYFENLDERIKKYFKILSPEIPEFLEEYIETKPMQKQAGISVSCGTFYSKLFPDIKLWYSSLDHSVAVSLIIWNFTKDKKQTLSGLFHDIATPIFKYHMYPIADNDTPQLSSDRLEYTLSNGLGVKKEIWNLDEIKEIYQNIEIQKNEEGIEELDLKIKK